MKINNEFFIKIFKNVIYNFLIIEHIQQALKIENLYIYIFRTPLNFDQGLNQSLSHFGRLGRSLPKRKKESEV